MQAPSLGNFETKEGKGLTDLGKTQSCWKCIATVFFSFQIDERYSQAYHQEIDTYSLQNPARYDCLYPHFQIKKLRSREEI